jgi:hypothetical protein
MSLTKVTYSMISGAVVNVLDYGAVGDGITNDTVAIQTAVTAAGAGGTVFFPAGTYYTATGFNDGANSVGVHFEGVGEASYILGAGGINIITLNKEYSSVNKLRIRPNTYAANSVCVLINYTCSQFFVTNCLIQGFFQNPYLGIGIWLKGAESGLVSKNTVQYFLKAITFSTSTIGANANLIQANLISLNIYGVFFETITLTSDNTFVNNTIQGNEQGMFIGQGIGFFITLTGNHFENNIGTTPIDLKMECGGGSTINSFGNLYAAYSDTPEIVVYNIYINTASQVQFNSSGDNWTKIYNAGDATSSSFYAYNHGGRDYIYNTPTSPPFVYYISSAAVPAGGIWQKGSNITNSNPTIGQPAGWVCTNGGSLSNKTATGTRATDGSTGVITGVTNASTFVTGDYVNVSAGFASTGPFIILAVGTSSLTVNANSNSVQAGVAITQGVPVFPAFSALPNL